MLNVAFRQNIAKMPLSRHVWAEVIKYKGYSEVAFRWCPTKSPQITH
jgi:hypothetical protein